MRQLRTMSIGLLLLVAALTARAYPNLTGTTGVVGTPTADIVGNHAADWAADLLFFDATSVNGRVVLGLSDRLEAGAMVDLGNDNGFAVQAKYRIYSIPRSFMWSIGAAVAGQNHGNNGSEFYIVGTKPISSRGANGVYMLGSVGLNYTDIEDANGLRPFLNAQLFLGTDKEISGEYEFRTGSGFGDAIASAVYRQHFSGRWGGEIGLSNANGFAGAHDHDVFLGLRYAYAP